MTHLPQDALCMTYTYMCNVHIIYYIGIIMQYSKFIVRRILAGRQLDVTYVYVCIKYMYILYSRYSNDIIYALYIIILRSTYQHFIIVSSIKFKAQQNQ